MPADPSRSDQLQRIMKEAFDDEGGNVKDRLDEFFRGDRRHLYSLWYAERPAAVIGVYDGVSVE
jgi:hypothetical protein